MLQFAGRLVVSKIEKVYNLFSRKTQFLVVRAPELWFKNTFIIYACLKILFLLQQQFSFGFINFLPRQQAMLTIDCHIMMNLVALLTKLNTFICLLLLFMIKKEETLYFI